MTKELPKGIRQRVKRDGTISYYAYVYEKGERVSLGDGRACKTVDEAVALRHAYYQERAREGEVMPVDLGVLTLRQLGELYIDQHGQEWDDDRWRARVVEMAEFIDWPITQIEQITCRKWVAHMARTPIKSGRSAGQLPTRGTLQSAISLLRTIFTWACMPEQGYLTQNPMEGVTISSSTKARPKSKRNLLDYLREDEARKLYEAPDDLIGLEPKTKYCVLMFSGARPGDVWRLEWPHIDWEAKTVKFAAGKRVRATGESAEYTVHMLPQLFEALRKWHLRCGRRTSGLVFPNPDGKVFARGYDAGWTDKRYRQNRFKVARDGQHKDGRGHAATKTKAAKVTTIEGHRKRLGIAREVPLYALRHTCACQLLLGGKFFSGGRRWSREEVQSQLGHKDSKATEHYMRALGIVSMVAVQDSREALRVERELQKRGR